MNDIHRVVLDELDGYRDRFVEILNQPLAYVPPPMTPAQLRRQRWARRWRLVRHPIQSFRDWLHGDCACRGDW